jgi:hypothetical protein
MSGFVPLLELTLGGNIRFTRQPVVYTTPNGITFRAPSNYVAVPAQNGKGMVLLPEGQILGDNRNIIRYGEPNLNNPQGYFRYYNSQGQPVNPNTGKPGTQLETHIPANFRGPLKGYPGRE